MRARESYRVTAVRLVEFHNLGTATVELPEGGHLFLLGDNGSGKTTLLDAIHLVLTAGREMEFNSAARVAGAKDSGGRTYQGVVLRYNAVTGRTARESGITYAALELKSDQGRTLSLVVGLAADGLDVQIERWGGIASVPVSALPLTLEENGRTRVATAAEFKRGIAALTGGRAFTHINEYADAVGMRLFGGADKYADVCKLLRTGKAYREIAARAMNYDDLFRQLLEDPSRETFEPLLKGLRELEESKARLEEIDERAQYLKDLERESRRLGDLRLKTDMVAWAEAERRHRKAGAEAADLAGTIASGEADCAALKKATVEAHAETERQRARLMELRAKDATGLVNREKRAAVHFNDCERLAEEAAGEAKAARHRAEAEEKVAETARKACHTQAKTAGEALTRLAKTAGVQAGRVTDALFAVANGTGGGDVEEAFSAVREVVRTVCGERQSQVFAAEHEAASAEEAVRTAEGEVAAIRAQGAAPGCDARHLALIERLLGEDFLATWVIDSDQADLVRRNVWKAEGEMAVAERGAIGAADPTALVPWIGNFISFEESDVEAVRLVAAQLASTIGPKDEDFLSLKTWTYRFRQGLFAEARPRLIGRKAREAEQARRLKAAEEKHAEAERWWKQAEKARVAAEIALAAVRLAEANAAAEELEDIRLKMREAGIDGSLEKKVAAVERKVRAGEVAERELHIRRGEMESREGRKSRRPSQPDWLEQRCRAGRALRR